MALKRPGIGYKAPRKSRKMRKSRSRPKSKIYRIVRSMVGRPEIKYTHYTFQTGSTPLKLYLDIYDSYDTTTLEGGSYCRAFVFPQVGTDDTGRIGNKITMRKAYLRLLVAKPIQSGANWKSYGDSFTYRIIVFSGFDTPPTTTQDVTGFFRWSITAPNILNQVDKREFTVWYDKTFTMKNLEPIQYEMVSGNIVPVAGGRMSRLHNINFKFKGKFREVTFDSTSSINPKEFHRQQLYIAVIGMIPGVPSNTLLPFTMLGNGTLYYSDS